MDELFETPARLVFVHPAEERGVREEDLRLKVPFCGVPSDINTKEEFVRWATSVLNTDVVLSSKGWMTIPTSDPTAPLPASFEIHLRNRKAPGDLVILVPPVKTSAQTSARLLDRGGEVLRALAQPFQQPIPDSPAGIIQLLNEPLLTRLPVSDEFYDSCTSLELKSKLAPYRELPAVKLSGFFTYVLLGGTDVRSGSSEASHQSKWDDLTLKPMQEVLNGTPELVDVHIDRNTTDPSGTSLQGKRPDMWVTCGELVYDQEEKKKGSLQVPSKELFEKLSCMDPIYQDNATRSFIVGVATSGNTIAYYALDRCLRTPPVPAVGPLLVNSPEMIYQVLRCSFNSLRLAVTVGLERQQRSLSNGLVLGHCELSRFLDVTRTVDYFPSFVKKTIKPFARHEALGLTTLDYAASAYAAPCDWGKAWALGAPKCTKDGVYSVQVQPLGVRRLPATEDELRIAIRCVLQGLKALHAQDLVHRDVRWPNVLYCGSGWFLMDFETVWEAGKRPCCAPFKHWAGMPMKNGCYTKECDLWLVGRLLREYQFNASESYNAFKAMLGSLTEQSVLTAEQVLSHEWLLS